MISQNTFAEKVLEFNRALAQINLCLPDKYRIINPYSGGQKELVHKITTRFTQKHFNDTKPRRLILGSSPARSGTAVTGVPFEDAKYLQKETGIFIDKVHASQASSRFLYDVMRNYGGREKFYDNFFMSFVCPLGLVKTNTKGNEVNCNYYESKKLQEYLLPFIVSSLRSQIKFGVDTSVCHCIGSGENYKFLTQINNEYHFFEKIIPLEHPRFITQYNSKNIDWYMKKYMTALRLV